MSLSRKHFISTAEILNESKHELDNRIDQLIVSLDIVFNLDKNEKQHLKAVLKSKLDYWFNTELTGKFSEWFADENNNFNGDRFHDATNKGLPIHL